MARKPVVTGEVYRVYPDHACTFDGYPWHWHHQIKHEVREQAGHRCERCHHPFVVGETPGEWSPCDDQCTHGGFYGDGDRATLRISADGQVEARWRVLTVHHLNGVKADCRWWNLVALCQRCHLEIQGKVKLDRPYWGEHTDWFKIYAAAWYALTFLGEELTREQTMARLDELLALEHRQLDLTAQ